MPGRIERVCIHELGSGNPHLEAQGISCSMSRYACCFCIYYDEYCTKHLHGSVEFLDVNDSFVGVGGWVDTRDSRVQEQGPMYVLQLHTIPQNNAKFSCRLVQILGYNTYTTPQAPTPTKQKKSKYPPRAGRHVDYVLLKSTTLQGS